jgi:hypothetical protein
MVAKPNLEFAPGVRGKSISRGSELAISLISTTAGPLPSPAIRFTGSNFTGSNGVLLADPPTWTCYDRLGTLVSGATVSVSGL